jgi:hypothetical protein
VAPSSLSWSALRCNSRVRPSAYGQCTLILDPSGPNLFLSSDTSSGRLDLPFVTNRRFDYPRIHAGGAVFACAGLSCSGTASFIFA